MASLATLVAARHTSAAEDRHMQLKRYVVTIRVFDPAKGLASGTDFELPVDSPDEEHAAASTMSNAVSFTTKTKDGAVLPVAFCCTAVRPRT